MSPAFALPLRLSLVLLALAVTARADDYPYTEAIRHSAAFDATGVLTLSNINGNVTVRAWDRDEILIEGEKAAKTQDELQKIDFTLDVSPRRAELRTRLPKRSGFWIFGSNVRGRVTLTIHLPATAQLEHIETVNAQVSLDGMRGGATVETVNGGIEARELAGAIALETVNGAINVSLRETGSQHQLDCETVNGPITVALPPDAAVNLDAEVVNGSIHCDFPLTLQRSSSRKQLSGTIGGGGAQLDVETVNGSIRIVRQ